jgi:hypothetical protein
MRWCRFIVLGLLPAAMLLSRSDALAQNPSSCNFAAPVHPYHAGYLHFPCEQNRFENIHYCPQPGDIILYDCMIALNHFAYRLAGTDAPTHSAIVFEGADHHMELLDLSGPNVIQTKVALPEVDVGLSSYQGKITVRRLRYPLSAEQNAALTEFAVAQEGKHFATFRGLLQLTPFRPRVGLRRLIFGHTYFDRDRWLCSELVVAAAARAGILDPDAYPANAIYPRDLACDDLLDLSESYEPPVEWLPEPPTNPGVAPNK